MHMYTYTREHAHMRETVNEEWGRSSEAECLPRMCEVLGSNPSITTLPPRHTPDRQTERPHTRLLYFSTWMGH